MHRFCTRPRPVLVAGIVCWAVLLSACVGPGAPTPSVAPLASATETASATAESASRAAAPSRAAATAMPSPTGTSTPEPGAALVTGPLISATAALAPIAPLQDTQIVDRLIPAPQPLTDGSRKYRYALWDPGSDWIAATPQDGPGMDAVNAATGEVRAVVTDTYVLEPVWLAPQTLLVHAVTPGGDQIARVDLGAASGGTTLAVEGGPPLRAVGAAGGSLSFVREGQLHLQPADASPAWQLGLDALTTAPSPATAPSVALTPWTEDLEQVRTVVARPGADGITVTPLSEPGEGLWLPRWAPDANRLVLVGIGGRLVAATADGSARYDLGPGDLPAWSPDSHRVAFAGTSAGLEFTTRDIHIVDWEGRGPRLRVTAADAEQFYTSPSWSPDGRRLAFVEIDSGQVFVGAAPRP